MARSKLQEYIVDGLTEENAPLLQKSLDAIPKIDEVAVLPRQNLVRLRAKGDVSEQVKMACDIAQTRFRTKVN